MTNLLSEVHSELISEWSEKNLPLTLDKITYGSNKVVWWKGSCGHEWTATVKSRAISGTGCPYCSHNKVLVGCNDLASQRPQIASECLLMKSIRCGRKCFTVLRVLTIRS